MTEAEASRDQPDLFADPEIKMPEPYTQRWTVLFLMLEAAHKRSRPRFRGRDGEDDYGPIGSITSSDITGQGIPQYNARINGIRSEAKNGLAIHVECEIVKSYNRWEHPIEFGCFYLKDDVREKVLAMFDPGQEICAFLEGRR